MNSMSIPDVIFSEFPPVELLVLNIKAPAVVLAAAFSQIAPICAAETMEVPILVWSLKEIRLPKLLATVPVESLSMVKLELTYMLIAQIMTY